MAYSPNRTVYPQRELPHIWAHGQNGERRLRSTGSISVRGNRIYSYQTEMARRIVINNNPIFLLNWHHYSVTTSAHQSHIRRAIPRDARVFTFDFSSVRYFKDFFTDVENKNWRSVLDTFQSAIDDLCKQALEPRIQTKTRMKRIGEANLLADQWRELHTLFKFRCKVTRLNCPASLEDAAPQYAKAVEKERQRVEKENAEYEAREARRRAEQDRRNKIIFAAVSPHIPAWRDGRAVSVADPERPHHNLSVHNFSHPLLRLEGDNLVTSHHASVPITEAKRLLALLPTLLSRLDGSPLHSDTISIGGYRGITLSRDTLTIGCHHIPWSEVRDFCNHYGWSCPHTPH